MTQENSLAPEGPAQEAPSEREFLVSPAPHLWKGFSVSQIMYLVMFALFFPLGAGIYFFGQRAISVTLVCVGSAVLTEFVCKKMRGHPFIMDGSAVVTGILLALVLPPTIPLWMAGFGAAFAIAIVKEAFGGLGHNIFNPALGARAFLSISFPKALTTWILPTGFAADAVTTATPLGESFVWQADQASLYNAMFFGNHGGCIGETSTLFILIGAALLFARRVISWEIPVTYIGMVALLSIAFGEDPVFQVMAGGLMLGAFFMATDYVTSPLTSRGKIVFGLVLGVLTVLIRRFGGMPEGVCFSILFMNGIAPLIDRHFKTKPYGVVKLVKKVAIAG